MDEFKQQTEKTTLSDRLTGEDVKAQRDRTQEVYEGLSEREKQIQASFWAQNFLIAELATANRLLRNLLVEKGVFTQEEDNKLADAIINKDTLRLMYENTERAFYDKYQRVRFAMENPEQVEKQVMEIDRPEGKIEGEDSSD